MKETIDTIIKWHKNTFKDANLEGQINKYAEETNEFMNTDKHEDLLELADMVIVSAGIARFAYCLGLDYLCGAMTLLDKTEWSAEALWQAVEKKMHVNMTKRNWDKDPVVGYKHKDK